MKPQWPSAMETSASDVCALFILTWLGNRYEVYCVMIHIWQATFPDGRWLVTFT